MDQIQIFISYAREDQPQAREIYRRLHDAGYKPWLDEEDLLPGQNFRLVIERSLTGSDFVIICLSRTSVAKRSFFQREIKHALDKLEEMLPEDIFLIPARLDPCEMPEELKDRHWVDLFDERGWEKLFRALDHELRKRGKTPPQPIAIPAQPQKSPVENPVPQTPRKLEVRRIESPPQRQPEPSSPPEEVAGKRPPAPEPPRERKTQVERIEPEWVAVKPPGELPFARAFFRSSKRRIGVAASILAATAMLGYVSWSQLFSKPSNSQPPVGNVSNLFTEDLGNGVKIEMINLPGGEFTMRSNKYDDEKPPHQVKVSPFAIGKYEVTQRQWKAVMLDNPSRFNWSDVLPVENVSWEMARDFIKRLNARGSGGTWRLPTEAEWEYAARAGSRSRYSFGDDASQLHNYAWFWDNSDYGMQAKQTHPVGRLRPNEFGLYDIHGNVWEWCSDWYGESYYKQSAATDPQGPSTGSYRVFRGGGWNINAVGCRSAIRNWYAPGSRDDDLGFRLVRVGP